MKTTLLSLTAFAASVAAHGAVTSYVIDGTTYPGYQGFSPSPNYNGIQMSWPDYNPSTATSASAKCNGGTSAPNFAVVRPGSTVRALWAQWTHAPSTYAVYLYPCSSFPCSTTGAQWFKIDEAGPLGTTAGDENWAGNVIMKTGGYTSTIPNIRPGKYVIRHELVARHQANNPQFYAECAQIEIQGSGTAFPDSSYQVAIPSTAFADPSSNMLNFEVNGSTFPSSQYKVHGPPVFGRGGSTPAPVTTTTTSRPAGVTTTTTTSRPGVTTTTTTTRAPVTTTTTTRAQGGTGASLYGQCGGQGWTGPTTCASGTCRVSNQWYSQCLP